MKTNPRPIPIDLSLVNGIVEQIIEMLELLTEQYKRTQLANVPFDLMEGYITSQVESGKYPSRVLDGLDDVTKSIHPKKYIPVLRTDHDYTLPFRRTFNAVDGRKIDVYRIVVEFVDTQSSEIVLGAAWIDVRDLPSDEEIDKRYEEDLREFAKKVYAERRKKNESIIRVKLNGSLTAKDYINLLKDKYIVARLKMRLREMLMHELTHGHDVIHMQKYIKPDRWSKYINQKVEVRAELQVVTDMMRIKLADPREWAYLRDEIARVPIDDALVMYLPDHWEDYTPKNQMFFLSAMVQWLNENGYTLPRRRF